MPDEAPDDFAMENVAPPPPAKAEGMPEKASPVDVESLEGTVDRRPFYDFRSLPPSIGLAAVRFKESCEGGGYFANNCAHYLANAFAVAGYSDLLRPHAFVNARCYRTGERAFPGCDPRSKRPIRAKEMEKWFISKARRTKDLSRTRGETVQQRFATIKNTGLWAVFQRDTEPGAYWGGHVCIIDTDKWKYYGTGFDGYWYWEIQHCYQW